jgi:hypothetical protein
LHYGYLFEQITELKKIEKPEIYLIHKIDETFIISIVDFTIAQSFKINELKNESVFKSEEE